LKEKAKEDESTEETFEGKGHAGPPFSFKNALSSDTGFLPCLWMLFHRNNLFSHTWQILFGRR
jgi:hypothetical protein